MSRQVALSEVAANNSDESSWIVIDSVVYDVTKFAKSHPGGKGILLQYAGKDCTKEFFALHKKSVLAKYGPKLRVGTLQGETPYFDSDAHVEGGIDTVTPYAESPFWRGFASPYYRDSHQRFRLAVRRFLAKEVLPDAEADEEAGTEPSKDIYEKMGSFGLLTSRIGVAAMPLFRMGLLGGVSLPGGVKPEEFDYFHELIAHEEMGSLGYPGVNDGLGAGFVIGLPPLLHFGTDKIRKEIIPDVMKGKKRICLAISEPGAGSDVANVMTTATKTPDGKFYIVNGVKKWITNGNFSDLFVTAVRTGKGGKGGQGLSLLLIDRKMGGVTTKKIKTSYSPAAGTALVFYENCKVPVENLLGKENRGFECIMFNFNHERWFITAATIAACRKVLAECYRWATQREAFGKRLIDQPVVRQHIAGITTKVETMQAWMEHITYQMQMTHHDYKKQNALLGGPIALMKYECTRNCTAISDMACQVFGGRAITKTGMGGTIERFQRTFKFSAILGGSEEIMADLGVRQAVRGMERPGFDADTGFKARL